MKVAKATSLFSGVFGLVLLAVLFAKYGLPGFVGGVTGLGIALLSIWSFAMLGAVASSETRPQGMSRFTVAILLGKLPIFALSIYLVSRLGEAATGCFLAGLALVYSALVLAGLLDRQTGNES